MNNISSYEDYLAHLQHSFCISTGKRKKDLRKILLKEIAEKYEYDHPTKRVEDEVEDTYPRFNEDYYLDQAAQAAGY